MHARRDIHTCLHATPQMHVSVHAHICMHEHAYARMHIMHTTSAHLLALGELEHTSGHTHTDNTERETTPKIFACRQCRENLVLTAY